MRCAPVNKAPRTIQSPPTTTYAMPRNGFLPPMTVRVEMMMAFVPPYFLTGKSIEQQITLVTESRVP